MAKQKPARERLKELRERKQLTQEEFGARVGVSDGAIARYESDDPSTARVPRLPIAGKIYAVTKSLGDAISPLDWCV